MKIPVFIKTTASKYIGHIEIDDPNQFKEAANALWQKIKPPPLYHRFATFDLGEWEVDDSCFEYFFKGRAFIPECCKSCEYLDSEQEDYKPETFYCQKNIVFPTKKQTCEKQSI